MNVIDFLIAGHDVTVEHAIK